jgi:hypothetical protein
MTTEYILARKRFFIVIFSSLIADFSKAFVGLRGEKLGKWLPGIKAAAGSVVWQP